MTLSIGVVLGTLLPPRQAEAQQPVTYSSPAVIQFHFIKPSARADYEAVMSQLSQALQQSANTEHDRQAQARGWKVYRAGADFSGQGMVPYVHLIDPVISGADYGEMNIMNEVFVDEIQEIYENYQAMFTDAQLKILPVELTLVEDF